MDGACLGGRKPLRVRRGQRDLVVGVRVVVARAVKLARAPVSRLRGCMWLPWCRAITCQPSAESPSAPSCASLAEPLQLDRVAVAIGDCFGRREICATAACCRTDLQLALPSPSRARRHREPRGEGAGARVRVGRVGLGAVRAAVAEVPVVGQRVAVGVARPGAAEGDGQRRGARGRVGRCATACGARLPGE